MMSEALPQAVSGNMVITYYADKGAYSIMMREKRFPTGYIVPSRSVNLIPALIAEGEDPIAFAEMLEDAAEMIRQLAIERPTE